MPFWRDAMYPHSARIECDTCDCNCLELDASGWGRESPIVLDFSAGPQGLRSFWWRVKTAWGYLWGRPWLPETVAMERSTVFALRDYLSEWILRWDERAEERGQKGDDNGQV